MISSHTRCVSSDCLPGTIFGLCPKHCRIADPTYSDELREIGCNGRRGVLDDCVECRRLEDHVVDSYIDDMHLVLGESTRLVLEVGVNI